MKINFHKIIVYNQWYSFIGAILLSIGTYYDINKKGNDLVVWVLLISALFFILLAFKKPKRLKADDQS